MYKNITDNSSFDVLKIYNFNKIGNLYCYYEFIRKNINKFDAFITLGCVIKGQTPHFDLICNAVFNAILKLSIDFNKPIANGIITALNMNQAMERSKNRSNKKPNKGSEAANALISILKNEPKKI